MNTNEKIKQRRIELGLTQKQLADRIGLKFASNVGYYEISGANLSLKTLKKIAVALDINFMELL